MRILLLILAMFIAGCQATAKVDIEAEKAKLAAFGDEWRAAYEVGNFDALENLYEYDAWLMAADKPARKGIDEIMTYFKTSRASGAKASIVFENESRIVDGNYAFETAHWWLEFPRKDGESYLSSGRSLLVFKRGDDGKWRVWRDIDNHTPDVVFKDRPQ